jgi:hypothetical protein
VERERNRKRLVSSSRTKRTGLTQTLSHSLDTTTQVVPKDKCGAVVSQIRVADHIHVCNATYRRKK